tara:strand:+ start:1995 stop:2621 length:627 start_codon:yes stop_codon:yes gene_type:complete
MTLAVLLRNCAHDNNATSTTYIRYALKADTIAINVARSPVQFAIPGSNPNIMDLGQFRPALSISGIVDNVGTASTTTSGFENMESMSITRKYWASTSNYTDVTQTYYVPYKNKLEEALYTWIYNASVKLEVEFGDANFPRYNIAADTNGASTPTSTVSGTNSETGGALYKCSIQACRFNQVASQEDRWEFQMQLVSLARADTTGISGI